MLLSQRHDLLRYFLHHCLPLPMWCATPFAQSWLTLVFKPLPPLVGCLSRNLVPAAKLRYAFFTELTIGEKLLPLFQGTALLPGHIRPSVCASVTLESVSYASGPKVSAMFPVRSVSSVTGPDLPRTFMRGPAFGNGTCSD
jgi:hypothetical protein